MVYFGTGHALEKRQHLAYTAWTHISLHHPRPQQLRNPSAVRYTYLAIPTTPKPATTAMVKLDQCHTIWSLGYSAQYIESITFHIRKHE